MFCTACGRPLAPEYTFCPACGNPTVSAMVAGPATPSPYQFRALGGVSVGVIAGTWLYWLLSVVPLTVFVVRYGERTAWNSVDLRRIGPQGGPPVLVIGSIFALGGFVALLVWLHRARVNLAGIPGAQPSWGPGWTVGAWFIPVANLLLVPAVVADVARNSGAAEPRRPHLGALAVYWWIFWALGSLLLNGANSGGSTDVLVALGIFGAPLVLIANVLLTLLLIRVNRVQDRARYGLVPVLGAAA
jgi:hypothetical protein